MTIGWNSIAMLRTLSKTNSGVSPKIFIAVFSPAVWISGVGNGSREFLVYPILLAKFSEIAVLYVLPVSIVAAQRIPSTVTGRRHP